MPRCPNPRCQMDYEPGRTRCTNPFCRCMLPEAVVAGRYRIETLIGMGGMGAVYRVSDTFEMTQVAVKILSLTMNGMDETTSVERFRREARYAHQLHHRNIVPVLNFGQDGELLYLVMPIVTGGTLKSLLKAERPLPTQQAQNYLNDLAAAIDAVHSHPQKIIHRDIKPSNLLIHQDDGRLVLADFGIARAMEQEKPLTQRGWSLGTEHYIAPEQEHGQAQPASDIYAMGVVAYQMFTGLLPFQAVVKSRAVELPTPSKLNWALPEAIDAVIMRAMEIDPNKRHRSASAFAQALNDALVVDTPIDDVSMAPTIISTSNANIIVRAMIPENPCAGCGKENRRTSRFCRHCGHTLDDTSPLVTEVCQVGYLSETGRKAPDNEDMLLVIQGLCVTLAPPPRPFTLLAVADGLRSLQDKPAGGHEASRLAIETVADILLPQITTVVPPTPSSRPTPKHDQAASANKPSPARTPKSKPPADTVLEQWLREAARQANQVIYHCNADYETTMASTLTIALIYKRHLYVASIGDSRAYHYSANNGSLQRITTDHTLGANMVEANLLQPDELYESAKRNQHYRYLGQTYQVTVDLFQQVVEPNDLILLCTDGLWHMLRDERITELLAIGGDPQKLAHILIEAANNAGGDGNVSAIVVRIQ